MALSVRFHDIHDPDGHNPALLLKGDWLIVEISDGKFSGYGEASHSNDDDRCKQAMLELFHAQIENLDLTIGALTNLERGAMASDRNFVEATAISGINQALYELLARRENVPVWRLLRSEKCRDSVPAYATINRALRARTQDDYIRTIERACAQGFQQIKCAPFEAVTKDGDQVEQSRTGLDILKTIRSHFPDLGLRIDFHERFGLENFLKILPEVEAYAPFWIEAPIPIGPDYKELRRHTQCQMALGELFFGIQKFEEIASNHWADVIMPDVKHVGGFGPLIHTISHFQNRMDISPHNPSGPVATAASLHAAAVSPQVTSIEIPLILQSPYYANSINNGELSIPIGPGWGTQLPELGADH